MKIFGNESISTFYLKTYIMEKKQAGTPGNRTQHLSFAKVNGFEGRGEHQPLNHSQIAQPLIGRYNTL